MAAHADYIPQKIMFELGFWPGPGTFYERGPGTYPEFWFMFANVRCPMKCHFKFNVLGDAIQTIIDEWPPN